MKQSIVKFHFRAETIKDSEGHVISKKERAPSLQYILPTLESEDLLSIIEAGGNGLNLLLEVANDVIYRAMRAVISDAVDNKKSMGQELVEANQASLDWAAIANKPKAERGGTGFSKEDLEAFIEDYKQVMATVEVSDGRGGLVIKTADQIDVAVSHISKRFANCRFNKPVIAILRSYLATWYANTTDQESFAALYETLDSRADTLLKADDTSRLADAL